jgi:hypothetical protein
MNAAIGIAKPPSAAVEPVTMTIPTPTAAPLETPIVYGSASGFRSSA